MWYLFFMDKKTNIKELLIVFFVSFGIFAVSIIPFLVMNKGTWVYYGDFNVQQIPFYYHVHDAIRHGNFFYDWSTDLGGSLIGCYSFYLLGSPFFWLTIPFPTAWIPFIMPWLSALKYAVMAVGAYLFAKRYVKTGTGAYVAALLFAFSGYSGAVLVYNHFHDFVAFFPFWLILFEKMIESGKRAGFALMTALMLIVNYYFFFGAVVFIVIYFIIRYAIFEKNFRKTLLRGLRAFFSGLCGVLLGCVFFLPGIAYTIGNSRLSDTLNGYGLLSYSDGIMWLGIVKNVVMLPDVSGLNSMLNPDMARVSGIGGYLPLFSIAGVIAYFFAKKGRSRAKILMLTLLVCSFIPMLNAMFSAMNSEYYARWFYMPVLIMAVMTGQMVEERAEVRDHFKTGLIFVGAITISIIAMAVLPAKTGDGEFTVLGKLKNPEQLVSEIIFSTVMFLGLVLYHLKISTMSDRIVKVMVTVASLLTCAVMLTTGELLIEAERKEPFVDQMLLSDVSPLPEGDGFYRIETDEDIYNYPMFWGGHSITSFISTIPDSTLEFYRMNGITRKVTSNPFYTRIGIRTLLSGKYYLKDDMTAIETIGRLEKPEDLAGYKESFHTPSGFAFYENTNFIPMGFSFNGYVLRSEFDSSELTLQQKDKNLVHLLIIEDEDEKVLSQFMEHGEMYVLNGSDFMGYCDDRIASACSEFKESTYGFTATADMAGENLLFFSVPYEKGFTAYVDGEKRDIYRVDGGFMGVIVPEGTHRVEFKFVPTYLKEGAFLSLGGLVLLLVLIALGVRDYYVKKQSQARRV